MAGINQGRPETAIGEPIRLGSNNEFEIEQHPVSDRLIIRDTVNGKVAYVRKERGGEIGGDGVLIKALKEGKPMADDGRTYSTIQEAERNANGWVFVPPGTFTENVLVETESLTIVGAGYGSRIAGQSSHALDIRADDVTVQNLRCTKNNGSDNCVEVLGGGVTLVSIWASSTGGSADTVFLGEPNGVVVGCTIEDADEIGINVASDNTIVSNCIIQNPGFQGIRTNNSDNIFSNCIVVNSVEDGIYINGVDNIAIGNRITSSGVNGIEVTSNSVDSIVANNRISDSSGQDIDDVGSGTLLDSNLTGSAN